MRSVVFTLVLALLPWADALSIGVQGTKTARRSTAAAAVRMGAAPQTETKTRTKQKTSGGDGGKGGGGAGALQIAKPKRKTFNEDTPMWKVILLGDDEYEEEAVCGVLISVIPDITNARQATERYNEAMSTGSSLLITQPKEQAEHFCEQLARCDPAMIVYSKIEEE
jgi:ATP-dependent Clp protease adapter protein ClpS